MTTAIDTATPDPFRQSAEDYGRSSLECPEGVFQIRLAGNYGKGESASGAKFINLMFIAERKAIYDPTTGILATEEDLPRPYRFFRKYYVGKKDGTVNDFAVKQLNSWLHAVGYSTKGEFNASTNRHDFDLDEAMSATLDQRAWTRVTHKEDPGYGWQIELDDFDKKPRYRIRVNGATT